MASATRTVLSIRLRPLFIHHIIFPVNICGNSVWNAVRHDEASSHFLNLRILRAALWITWS